jgi:hypothetical protein
LGIYGYAEQVELAKKLLMDELGVNWEEQVKRMDVADRLKLAAKLRGRGVVVTSALSKTLRISGRLLSKKG